MVNVVTMTRNMSLHDAHASEVNVLCFILVFGGAASSLGDLLRSSPAAPSHPATVYSQLTHGREG